MAAFNKFDNFVLQLAHGNHALNTATLKVFLTNITPAVGTDTIYDGITGSTGPAEIAAGNGYTAGGLTLTTTSSTQTSGTYKLVCGDPAAITASGGSIGPFRYAVLYNSSSSNRLIGYWDYGTSITLLAAQQLQIDLDQVNGIFSIA